MYFSMIGRLPCCDLAMRSAGIWLRLRVFTGAMIWSSTSALSIIYSPNGSQNASCSSVALRR